MFYVLMTIEDLSDLSYCAFIYLQWLGGGDNVYRHQNLIL